MIDPLTTRRIAHRALFVALAAVILFLRLLPVNPMSHGVPGPDLTLAMTLAWVLRRPDYVPALLIVAVFFLEDLMFWRAPGLWTLIVLAATEFLRAREVSLRDMPFVLELALMGGLMVAMVLANRMVLALVMVDQPPLGLELLRLLMTLAAYPFVVALSKLAFGLRRAAPGEVDAFGHRL
ncbi:rod shape-determining protein MreD [Paenirhodobacter sp. CAU 1674]|jgi:rod shape-determining protein MreD|uniref:rod shape-determining protein MreD n=1 Tax=Paenirhodobacter sp. CAU 1674 TaxID=3032596 RepID=UPI0023DAB4A5|nr:rod shape-determining protein MreD [Paenirhodobacter sp. CAU 1674]MDF2141297.1 rod shape-determining protein MreD [Paenirhodobacter sp. CAU 1674]